MGENLSRKVRCGIVGYGRNFNFGRMHGRWINACPDMELVAVCDIDLISRENAVRDFPQIQIYSSVKEMLTSADLDLVGVVTPHNTHAAITVECLRAGKHVLVDKAMAISVKECNLMIEDAKRHNRSLTVFHNRRHDGNYRAIKEIIDQGIIGDVFHVECCEERYCNPGKWWYTNQEVSGGIFFFWGPHAVDWVLNLMRSKVVSVTGYIQKRVWMDVNIPDEIRASLLFENGATASINYSTISVIRRPLWRILGTKGGIEDLGEGPISGATILGYGEELTVPPCGSFRLVTVDKDGAHEREVPYKTSDWLTYYKDLADHLLRGKSVPVSGEEGRFVVSVLESAERSAKSGHTQSLPLSRVD